MNIILDAHDITLIGGIERFIAQFANTMAQRGHQVFLFTYAPRKAVSRFPLSSSIHVSQYAFSGDRAHIPALREKILACAPDVCISPASYNNHLLWCAALEGTGIPWIYSEHNNPWIIETERWNRVERQAVLCAADAVHLLLDSYRATVPVAVQKNIRVIPNPLDILPSARQIPTGKQYQTLLSLGRLAENKQNILLVRAFALLTPEFPTWRLEIWGEGDDRAALQREATSLGVQKSVLLPGATSTPQEQYTTADIFCMPSRYEGFGLTVIEAMACGLPVVGFAGCSGVNELVRHGENGLLAPDMNADSLAATLRTLMKNAELRRLMGKNALCSAQAFAPTRIFDAWEDLLRETAARKGQTRLQRLAADSMDNPELSRHYAVLQKLLRRKNVLLKDSQFIRRFVRRYPLLKKMFQPLRRLLRAAVSGIAGLRLRG